VPLISLVLLLAAAAPGRAETATELLAQLSQDQRQDLSEERVMLLDNAGDGKLVSALVLFTPPPEQVLPLVSAATRQVEYRPELKASTTIEELRDGVIEQQEMKLQVEQQRMKVAFVKLVFHLRFVIDEQHLKVSWSLAEGYENDLQEASGFWHLYPLKGGGTLARFGTRVDVGAMPGFLQDFATRKNVPKTLERTRRWVDSGGTWRP
jgi:hypothetical protein